MNLETYLRRATQGLWGQHKREVMQELRGSIEARIWALEHQGYHHDRALEMTLQELGDANAVSAGMRTVHLIPNLIRSTVLVMVFSSVALVSLQTSQAQVQVARPRMGGWTSSPLIERPAYLSLDDLKTSLENAGISVEESMQAPRTDRWPLPTVTGAKRPPNVEQTRTLTFQFPDAIASTQLQEIPGWTINENGQYADLASGEKTFVEGWYVLNNLLESRLPVRVEGWQNPRVTIGQTTIQVGTPSTPENAFGLYSGALLSVVGEAQNAAGARGAGAIFTLAQSQRSAGPFQHAFRSDAKPGTVYGVVSTQTIKHVGESGVPTPQALLFLNLARVNDRGVLEFFSAWQNIEFVSSIKALEADQQALRQANHDNFKAGIGTTKRPAKVVLVRMSGRLDRLEWINGQDPRGVIEVPARARSHFIR